MSTLNYEINYEIKRTQDKLADSENTDIPQQIVDARKILSSLRILREKITKRIQSLAEDSSRPTVAKFKLPSRLGLKFQPVAENDRLITESISLRQILEEYYQTAVIENYGGIKSPGLFYFLDYLAKEPDSQAAAKLRFWLSAESYQRLVWRISHGVGSTDNEKPWGKQTDPDKIDILPLESHLRLRKEVYQIYLENLVPISAIFPANILNSFERYIAPLLAPEAPSLDVSNFSLTIIGRLSLCN